MFFGEDISFLIAFAAGFVSFASPCILPMIPAYVSYITGTMNLRERSFFYTLSRSVTFVLGFSIIFIIMGASASYIGRLFYQHKILFLRISGLLIIVFGLHMMGIIKIPFLYREARFQGPKKTTSLFGSILLGMAFGSGWTPCVGPVLSSILLYAGTASTVFKGVYLLTAYSLGLGIPFILAAVLMHWFGLKMVRFNKYTPYISKISGGIMVLLGILIFFDLLVVITEFFYRFNQ
ncbi:cytochrome c biogenesis protein CcdA [Anoxybacter fermentans]|uniref:Cytochrome c biogenesis protein CcdA n=1 Tax=Anoxybacter fermentans TaxID=1323375 RepID=A0A3S9SY45_9FIRM|nr:cytochrome c biogenesis CcdA family protein [Anoxybacter fermentans]AZR73263.1 cytochrome c biogenesis protein CcdA [Anoxybacter fermentans]